MAVSKSQNSTTKPNTPTDKVGQSGAEIKVRCSPNFKKAFKRKADELNISMSQMVRNAYTRIDAKIEKKVVHVADPKLIFQLAKIGNNVNQIARILNQNNDSDFENLAVLKSIEQSLEDIKNGYF
jgi:hypothetical protein